MAAISQLKHKKNGFNAEYKKNVAITVALVVTSNNVIKYTCLAIAVQVAIGNTKLSNVHGPMYTRLDLLNQLTKISNHITSSKWCKLQRKSPAQVRNVSLSQHKLIGCWVSINRA